MKDFYELKDILVDSTKELDTLKDGRLKMNELEAIKMIASAVDHIGAACEREEGGYSQAGDWEARGRFGDQYAREGYNEGGNSYRRNRDSMGRYSREGGMYDDGMSRRMSRRGYSRGGDMMEHVDAMMDEAETDEQREAVRRFKKQLEAMK